MADNISKIEVTEDQKLWLAAICSKLRNSEPYSARSLQLELKDKLPNGFNPFEIDSRLLRRDGSEGAKITPLGIALVDPDSDFARKTDRTISAIRDILFDSPETNNISVDQISELTGIQKETVAAIFKCLAFVGVFHTSGTNDGSHGWGSIYIDKRTFDGYLTYQDMASVIESLIAKNAQTEVDFQPTAASSHIGVEDQGGCSLRSKKTLQEWAGAGIEKTTLALTFTDIVDSTALLSRMGDDKWISLLRKHFERARQVIKQLGGYEIKLIGDSVMVAFRTAADALRFAMDFYSNTGDPQITIRAGIHIGQVRIIDNDIYGHMVHLTSRVEHSIEGSVITLSNSAKEDVMGELGSESEEITFRRAQADLKGFGKQTVWQAIRAQKLERQAEDLPPVNIDNDPRLSRAKEIDRRRKLEAERLKLLTTDEGVASAQKEVDKLINELHSSANSANTTIDTYRLDFERNGTEYCILSANFERPDKEYYQLSSQGYSLAINWACKYQNTLDESELSVRIYKSMFDSTTGCLSLIESNLIDEVKYNFDLDLGRGIGWRNARSVKSFHSTKALAELCFKLLLNTLDDASEHGA